MKKKGRKKNGLPTLWLSEIKSAKRLSIAQGISQKKERRRRSRKRPRRKK